MDVLNEAALEHSAKITRAKSQCEEHWEAAVEDAQRVFNRALTETAAESWNVGLQTLVGLFQDYDRAHR